MAATTALDTVTYMSDVTPLAPDTPRAEELRKLVPQERAVRRRMFSTLLRTMVRRSEEGQ